ncbi:hypothetical protein YC2023_050629 [Brassica napus]
MPEQSAICRRRGIPTSSHPMQWCDRRVSSPEASLFMHSRMRTPSVSFSCLANKLLKLKDIVFPLIKQRLENGLSARFWFNNWTSFGTLASYLDSSTTRLGILLIELLLFVGMELG